MRRRRFLAATALLLAGCATSRRASQAPSGASTAAAGGLPATEPAVRVGLEVAAAAASFEPLAGRYLLQEAGADTPIAVTAPGETWGARLDPAGALRIVDPRGWLSRPHARAVRVEPLDPDTTLRVGDRTLAGGLELLAAGTGVTVVNELPLERYLTGVVAREMGGGGGEAALRAQAVAARTYALKRLGSRAELGFDLFADVQDQAYAGEGGRTASADAAVRSTRGFALLAGPSLIDAYYHSTCGGATAAVEEAFPRPAVPYLVSVSDADGDGGYHCDGSKYFRWHVAFEAGALERLLERNLSRFLPVPVEGTGSLVDLSVVESSPEGRVLALRFETTTGRFQVARNDVRWVFADDTSPGLRSTLFLLRKERSRGRLTRVELTGGGWGHGVGMCQIGAIHRAAGGAEHGAILERYYPGTRMERLYA